MIVPQVVYMHELYTNAIWALLVFALVWWLSLITLGIINVVHEVFQNEDATDERISSVVPIVKELVAMSRDAFVGLLGGHFLTLYLSMDGMTRCAYVSTWTMVGFFMISYLMVILQFQCVTRTPFKLGYLISVMTLYGCALSQYQV